jgi:hypothetical protein
MGGKRPKRRAVHTCPCGHEQETPGVCIVHSDGQWHDVPIRSNVCECHGLPVFESRAARECRRSTF